MVKKMKQKANVFLLFYAFWFYMLFDFYNFCTCFLILYGSQSPHWRGENKENQAWEVCMDQ